MTEQDQIAHFLATRGATRVAVGQASYGAKAMYRAVRGEKVMTIEEEEETQALIDARHVTIGSNGREYVRNGLGERIS